jgi:hypothetical protein
MIKSILSIYESIGIGGLLATATSRLFARKAGCFPQCVKFVSNGVGLEIGGPSSIFQKRRILPIYPIIGSLDNYNFADGTIWKRPFLQA